MPMLIRIVAFIIFALGGAAAIAGTWPTAGWETSTPEEQGIDPGALAKLVIDGRAMSLDSLLLIRGGKIVLDASYAPYSADMLHVVNSVTKAVVGTLAAIAIKDGKLQGPDQSVMPLFAARGIFNLDDNKRAITLQHLFDMTSGLEWQEIFGKIPQSAIDMEFSTNWVGFILNRPMAAPPGERFNYNSGNPHLVSAILARVTGMRTEDFARERLFGPLGITSWTWYRDPEGISSGGYGLRLHPRDMAKFGYLYLRRGEWDGRQLLPMDWIEKVNHATVDMKLSFAPDLRYANFFWANPARNVYWANGYHCQSIVVYPSLDLVAVTTGRDNCPMGKIIAGIAATVTSSSGPLSPDPAGSATLAAAIRVAATEQLGETSAAVPLASVVSGKVYRFPRNAMTVKSMAFTFAGAEPRYEFEFYQRDPASPPERFSGALGLDGAFRKGMDTPFGPLAIRGHWLDDHVFELERANIGSSEKSRKWTLSFEGDRLTLSGKNAIGNDVVVTGSAGE